MSQMNYLGASDGMPPLTARSRNLVRFGQHLPAETMDASFAGDFAFRDAGSRFSLLKSPKTAIGPDECYGLFARDGRLVMRKVLGVTLSYDGLTPQQTAKLGEYNSMNYYRSHVVEHFCHNGIEPLPPAEGECVFYFVAPDLLAMRYRVANKSPSPVAVRLALVAETEAGKGFTAQATAHGYRCTNQHEVAGHPYRSHAELLARDPAWAFTVDGTHLRTASVARLIPPHGVLEERFLLRCWFNEEAAPAWPADPWSDAPLAAAIAVTEAAYASLPALPAAHSQHLELTLKAAGTLRSLRYRDFTASGQPRMSIHAGKTGCGATWFWDSGATLPGLGLLREREAASGALRILLDGIKDDGTPPVTYEHQKYVYSYQIPILTWGTGHYLAACPDAALLAEAYVALSRYVRHWLSRFMTPLGLVYYPAGMTSLDDALRWNTGFPLVPKADQPWTAQEWGRPRQEQFLHPDVNAFLVLEMRTLANMADALGQAAEASRWRTQAEALATAINAYLIEPTTQSYQDRHLASGKFTGMINLASFIPVYAGIAPAAIATHLCRDYLLSPAHFLTNLPFPVIDRAHPTFRSGGYLYAPPQFPGALVQQAYWRGRTWIHTNSWYLGALWQAGLHQEADDCAERILQAVSRSEGIHECYDSLTGFGNGHPEFMWSSAAVLLMAHQFYRRPPVATLG